MNYIFVNISSAITIWDNLQTAIKTKALTHRSPEIQIYYLASPRHQRSSLCTIITNVKEIRIQLIGLTNLKTKMKS